MNNSMHLVTSVGPSYIALAGAIGLHLCRNTVGDVGTLNDPSTEHVPFLCISDASNSTRDYTFFLSSTASSSILKKKNTRRQTIDDPSALSLTREDILVKQVPKLREGSGKNKERRGWKHHPDETWALTLL